MKKYNIILADPPWDHGGNKLNAKSGGKEVTDHYSVMSIDEIKRLPVKQIADKNCLLFLWVVYPMLDKAFEVIKLWGFKYSTVAFDWIKTTPSGKMAFVMGMWTHGGGIELCLLAKRGSIKRLSKKVRKTIIAQRREHSRKPDEVRSRIVQLVGDLPRVELFAREKVDGWDSWGNEVKSDIDLIAKDT